MKRFFAPNIGGRGRVFRALLGLAFLGGAVACRGCSLWLMLLLAAAGGFCCWEALRGWCLARACGIKTRI